MQVAEGLWVQKWKIVVNSERVDSEKTVSAYHLFFYCFGDGYILVVNLKYKAIKKVEEIRPWHVKHNLIQLC